MNSYNPTTSRSEKEQVYDILRRRFDPGYLEGYGDGHFLSEGRGLVAHTLMPVGEEELTSWPLATEEDYAIVDAMPEHDVEGEVQTGGWTSYPPDERTSLEDRVKNGAIGWYSFYFIGLYWEGQWWIQKSLLYSNTNDRQTADQCVRHHLRGYQNEDLFFARVESTRKSIDYESIQHHLSEIHGRPVDKLNELLLLRDHLEGLQPDQVPWIDVLPFASDRAYIGQPQIVARLKNEQKQIVNTAFRRWVLVGFIRPFNTRLSINGYAGIVWVESVHGPFEFPMLHPESNDYVLFVVRGRNDEGLDQFFYFLYVFADKSMYRWTYPKERTLQQWAYDEFLDDLAPLTFWGRELPFLEAAITLDDEQFWNEYVFKKDGDKYRYLVPVDL